MSVSLLLICILLSAPAQAWELYPEYIGLVESEATGFNQISKIDSEYQSDFLTFTPSAAWHTKWLESSQALQMSVGSLSSKRFLLDNHLKLNKELTPGFEFDLIYIDERHFESDNESLMVQFSKKLMNNQLGLAIYGELESNKAQDDLGLSLSWFIDEKAEVKLFHTLVDYSRNKRNVESDEFLTKPLATGLVYRARNGQGEFLEASLRIESKTRWDLPSELAQFNYWRKTAQFYWRKNLGEDGFIKNLFLNLRLFSEQKWEERMPTSGASTVVRESWRTGRNYFQAEIEKNRWIYGLHTAYRRYESQSEEVGQVHYLPYLSKGFGSGLHQWRLGYEATSFRETGSELLRSATADSYAVEHRVNVAYEAHFSEESSMYVLLTFDGDELGTGETWEGGNIQFRSLF